MTNEKGLIVFIIIYCFFVHHNFLHGQSLVINEIMSSNSQTLADETGEYEDWIELFNISDEPIDLSGYYLTDDLDDLDQFRLPVEEGELVIPAEGYLLLWASGSPERGKFHLGFKLSAEGESLALVSPDGVSVIDSISFAHMPSDISYGRNIQNIDKWGIYAISTPLEPNYTDQYDGFMAPPEANVSSGFYSDEIEVDVAHEDDDIYMTYTLDGSRPTIHSAQWEGTTYFTNRTNDPNVYSIIPTNFISIGSPHDFRPPSGLIPKATILRVKAFKSNYLPAESIFTYFIFEDGGDDYRLPVFSIVVDSTDFFGHESGIYVPGVNYEVGDDGSGNYYQRGREWERSAVISFFENKELVLEQEIGVRIHGGWSRRWPQKTLRLYARNEYGQSTLDHRFFDLADESFKRLLLRNSGNDHHLSFIRDASAQALIEGLDLDHLAYSPSVLFLNGEYWGIHNIRERQDHHYLNRKYGLERTEIDLLSNNSEVKEGDDTHYDHLLNFISENDLDQSENFSTLNEYMDIDNYLNYISLQVYIANNDWPHNNIDWWRRKIDYNDNELAGLDGRWRWLVYDLDRSFGWISNVNTNMIEWITDPIGNGRGAWATYLFRQLIKGDHFKELFINRLMDHLNTIYQPQTVSSTIDRISAGIASEMPRHIDRWSVPHDMNTWQFELNRMKSFANNRPGRVVDHIQEFFELDTTFQLLIDINEKGSGYVKVNSVSLERGQPGVAETDIYPWSGLYFKEVSVRLEAIVYPGNSFAYWVVDGDTLVDDKISLITSDDIKNVEAFFMKDEEEEFFPEPFIPGTCPYVMHEWSQEADVGSFPPNMAFVYMDEEDPGINANVEGFSNGVYDQTSRTRIVGLDEDGLAFINTGNRDGNNGYPGRKLGGVLLAVNTRDVDNLTLWYKAKTLVKNQRDYCIRLQYAFSIDGPVFDVLDESDQPIVYNGHETGDVQTFGPIQLPEALMNRSYVLLFWRYQYVSGVSGPRDMLGVDDIMLFNGVQNNEIFYDPSLYSPEIFNSTLQDICSESPGSIQVSVNNGQPPYQYEWDVLQDQNNSFVSIDQPGSYAVTISDANDCTDSKSFEIRSSSTTVDSVETFPECNDLGNGFANVYLSNATLPVIYTIDDNVSGLEDGVITQWDFNADVPSDSPSPSRGKGEALLIGGAYNPSSGSNGTGSSDPSTDNQAWQTLGYPEQGEKSGEVGVQFNISTEGYENITFSFDQRLSNTTSTTWLVEYCTNVNASSPIWIEAEVFDIIAQHEGTGDTWYNQRIVDLRDKSDVEDNPDFGIRIVSVFKPNMVIYEPARWSSEYGGGTSRFDMVTFHGRPIDQVIPIGNFKECKHDIELIDNLGCLATEEIIIPRIDADAKVLIEGQSEVNAGDSTIYQLETLNLPDSIVWHVENGIIINDTINESAILIHWPEEGYGIVSFQVFLSNGCVASDTVHVDILEQPTAVLNSWDEKVSIRVYPNPCENFIIFETDETSNFSLEVSTVDGLPIENIQSNSKILNVNLSHLPPGLYIYRIITDHNHFKTGTFVKMK